MIIKNILRGLSPSSPRPDVMYDGGIIMKKRRKQGLWLRRNLPLLIAAAALVLLFCVLGFDLLFEPGPLRELSFGTPLGREYRFPLPLD